MYFLFPNILTEYVCEVMIKSVLQDIPFYVMSIFQLPSTLITTIERMIRLTRFGGVVVEPLIVELSG